MNLKIGTAVESIALSTAVRYDKEKKGGIRPMYRIYLVEDDRVIAKTIADK